MLVIYLFCNWHSFNTNYYGATFVGMPGSFNSSQINAWVVGIGIFRTSVYCLFQRTRAKCCPRGDSNPAPPACQVSAVPLCYSSPFVSNMPRARLQTQAIATKYRNWKVISSPTNEKYLPDPIWIFNSLLYHIASVFWGNKILLSI